MSNVTNINLLPPEIAAKRVAERRVGYIIVAGVLAVSAVFLVYLVLGFQVRSARTRLEGMQAEVRQRESEKALLQQFADRQDELKKKQKIAADVIDKEVQWAKLLNEISMIIPSDVWLATVKGSEVDGFTFQGWANEESPTAGETTVTVVQGHKPVAKWLVRLSLIKELTNIWLNSSKIVDFKEQPAVQFDNTAAFKTSHSPASASAPTAPPAATQPQTGKSPGG